MKAFGDVGFSGLKNNGRRLKDNASPLPLPIQTRIA